MTEAINIQALGLAALLTPADVTGVVRIHLADAMSLDWTPATGVLATSTKARVDVVVRTQLVDLLAFARGDLSFHDGVLTGRLTAAGETQQVASVLALLRERLR